MNRSVTPLSVTYTTKMPASCSPWNISSVDSRDHALLNFFVCLSVCLSPRLSLPPPSLSLPLSLGFCLSVCLSVSLSPSLCVCPSVCVSVWISLSKTVEEFRCFTRTVFRSDMAYAVVSALKLKSVRLSRAEQLWESVWTAGNGRCSGLGALRQPDAAQLAPACGQQWRCSRM